MHAEDVPPEQQFPSEEEPSGGAVDHNQEPHPTSPATPRPEPSRMSRPTVPGAGKEKNGSKITRPTVPSPKNTSDAKTGTEEGQRPAKKTQGNTTGTHVPYSFENEVADTLGDGAKKTATQGTKKGAEKVARAIPGQVGGLAKGKGGYGGDLKKVAGGTTRAVKGATGQGAEGEGKKGSEDAVAGIYSAGLRAGAHALGTGPVGDVVVDTVGQPVARGLAKVSTPVIKVAGVGAGAAAAISLTGIFSFFVIMVVMITSIVGAIVAVIGGAAACTPSNDSTSGSGSVPDPVSEEKAARAKFIWDVLIAEGFTPEAAAGIMGNLDQESGFDPTIQQYGGGPGRGIAQWTSGGGRWDTSDPNLLDFAASRNADPLALRTQVDFMLLEMNNGWGGFNVEEYKKMTNVSDATVYFHKEFEKSADSESFVIQVRGKYSQYWYDLFTGTGTTVPPAMLLTMVDTHGFEAVTRFAGTTLAAYLPHTAGRPPVRTPQSPSNNWAPQPPSSYVVKDPAGNLYTVNKVWLDQYNAQGYQARYPVTRIKDVTTAPWRDSFDSVLPRGPAMPLPSDPSAVPPAPPPPSGGAATTPTVDAPPPPPAGSEPTQPPSPATAAFLTDANVAEFTEKFGNIATFAVISADGTKTIFGGNDPLPAYAWSTMNVLVITTLIDKVGGSDKLSDGQKDMVTKALENSDNDAMTSLHADLVALTGGESASAEALTQMLRKVGDTITVVNPAAPGTNYGQTVWTAPEQAKFMQALGAGKLLDAPSTTYMIEGMGKVADNQRWGMGEVGSPAFKGGWGGDGDGGTSGQYELRQVGILEGKDKQKYYVTYTVRPPGQTGMTDDAKNQATDIAKWLKEKIDAIPGTEAKDDGCEPGSDSNTPIYGGAGGAVIKPEDAPPTIIGAKYYAGGNPHGIGNVATHDMDPSIWGVADIAIPVGTPLYAHKAGKVTKIGMGGAYYPGYIEIDSGNDSVVLYGHISASNVAVGDEVAEGQQIALSGASISAGYFPHLHLEWRNTPSLIDHGCFGEMPWLPGRADPGKSVCYYR